jgi:hypothetical protein
MSDKRNTVVAGVKDGGFLTRESDDATIYRIPYGRIVGQRPGPQITIFGGQHGTEYDGIEAVQRLYRTLQPNDITGTIVIALATNEASFLAWEQFSETPAPVAEMMTKLATGSQYLINCHGGEVTEGMNPYVICRLLGDDDLDRKARAMADAFGVKYVSFSKYRGEPPDFGGVRPAWWLWPSKSMADELGIPEITPEVGERGSRDDHGMMYEGIINVLKTLGFLDGEPILHPKPRPIGDRFWLTSDHDGVFFPATRIDADVEKGQELGIVRDYFGDILQVVQAPASAKVMNMNWGMPVRKDAFLLWLGVIENS